MLAFGRFETNDMLLVLRCIRVLCCGNNELSSMPVIILLWVNISGKVVCLGGGVMGLSLFYCKVVATCRQVYQVWGYQSPKGSQYGALLFWLLCGVCGWSEIYVCSWGHSAIYHLGGAVIPLISYMRHGSKGKKGNYPQS